MLVWIQKSSGITSSLVKEGDEYVRFEGPDSYWTPPSILIIDCEGILVSTVLDSARCFQNYEYIINDNGLSNEL